MIKSYDWADGWMGGWDWISERTSAMGRALLYGAYNYIYLGHISGCPILWDDKNLEN